ncbi:MAG: large-conductance mechanosensitive channel protein MscL [Gemmatimonadota bacterium]|nr:large-conductance mechanosensitive channel protein MscL [Gemmatimonadota bacterium]
MLKEFKEFAVKGNMLDMAVGIVIGAAFGTIVTSLVNDVIMPPIGLALGGLDFSQLHVVLQQGTPAGPYETLAAAAEAGAVTLNWGAFVNSLISFLIIAIALFIVIKGFNELKREEEPTPEPEAPPAPSAEETLLTEIRDLLRANA